MQDLFLEFSFLWQTLFLWYFSPTAVHYCDYGHCRSEKNIELLTKYPLSQNDRIVVFEIRLRSESPMLYRPELHGNWNGLSLARRALKDEFPTSAIPITAVLSNRQVILPDSVHLLAGVALCTNWHPILTYKVMQHDISPTRTGQHLFQKSVVFIFLVPKLFFSIVMNPSNHIRSGWVKSFGVVFFKIFSSPPYATILSGVAM